MNKNFWLTTISVIGAFLLIIAAIIQYYDKKDSDGKAAEAERKAEEFNTQLIESQRDALEEQRIAKADADVATAEIIRLTNQVNSHTSNLLEDSEKARKIQEETIKFLLGSRSGKIGFFGFKQGVFAPYVLNDSPYPVYDMTLKISDYDEIAKCEKVIEGNILILDHDCEFRNTSETSKNFISSNSHLRTQYGITEADGTKHLRIETNSRAGVVEYFCVVKIKNNSAKFCIRVYNIVNNERVFVDQYYNEDNIPDESYWIEHFFSDKLVFIGSLQNLKPEQ